MYVNKIKAWKTTAKVHKAITKKIDTIPNYWKVLAEECVKFTC